MSTGPSVTIVIPAYNASAHVERVVRAARAQSGLASNPAVIVVDDGSTDDTAAVARSAGAEVVSQPNRGPAAARNHGWRAAEGADLVWFVDSDCFAEPGALALLLPAFDAPDVAAAGGSYANARPGSRLARVVHAEILVRHARMHADVRFLGSYHLVVRRSTLLETGGFDETYARASGEDNDLSYRLRRAGKRLRFVRESRVAHLHPTNLLAYCREQYRHGVWRMKLYRDHPAEIRGDDYSGPLDFLEPPLALLVVLAAVALAPIALARAAGTGTGLGLPASFPNTAAIAIVAGLVLLALIALPAAARIARADGVTSALVYLVLRPVRAAARGFGMARGVLRFWIRSGDAR